MDIDTEVTAVQQEDTLENLEIQIALREKAVPLLQEQLAAPSTSSHGAGADPLVAPVQLAEQIRMYLRAVASLKARRNELLPISRIPPEVLGYIFLLATREDMHSCYAKPGIKLSQVRHVWWEVVHGTASVDQHPSQLRELLLRVRLLDGGSRAIPHVVKAYAIAH